MIPTLLAAANLLGRAVLWAQESPGTELVRSGYAQMGFLALLLGLGWWAIRQADKRTEAAEKRAAEAEADARAVLREVIPGMTLQTARSEQLLAGMQQVVGVMERLMAATLDRPK